MNERDPRKEYAEAEVEVKRSEEELKENTELMELIRREKYEPLSRLSTDEIHREKIHPGRDDIVHVSHYLRTERRRYYDAMARLEGLKEEDHDRALQLEVRHNELLKNIGAAMVALAEFEEKELGIKIKENEGHK